MASKFSLGSVVMTPGAQGATTEGERITALGRHVAGDWGDVDEEDKATNDQSLKVMGMLMSVFKSAAGVRFYVITDPGHHTTTLLLPSEY